MQTISVIDTRYTIHIHSYNTHQHIEQMYYVLQNYDILFDMSSTYVHMFRDLWQPPGW